MQEQEPRPLAVHRLSRHGVVMRFIFATLAIALAVLAGAPLTAGKPDREKGAVVIGVVGALEPTLTWRPFDPATGKLLPFRITQNVAKGAQAKLTELFSGFGRLGRADKRFHRSDTGVSYRFAELPPGFYVLEAITAGRRRSVFGGTVPVVRIVAGQTTYAGDHAVRIDRQVGGRADPVRRDAERARQFVSTFPDLPSVLTEDDSGSATLICVGKPVAFADQIVCDAERSVVSDITLPETGK